MAIGPVNLSGSGGGDVVNGIIEQYYAENEEINANTFVEFVSDIAVDELLSSNPHSGDQISAVCLNDNKVFIAYSKYVSNKYYVYGMICTIGDGLITIETDTSLASAEEKSETVSAILIDNNKVFVAYSYNSYNYLYAKVCTINNSAITTGSSLKLSSNSYSGNIISLTLLDTNKVFIAHSGVNSTVSSENMNAMICTIDGTTITSSVDTVLDSEICSNKRIAIVTLDHNKIFIIHTKGRYLTKLYGMVCNVSDIIIANENIELVSSNKCSTPVYLNNGRIFFTYGDGVYGDGVYGVDEDSLHGMICTIDNTIVTVIKNSQLNHREKSGDTSSILQLDDNRLFIVHSGGYSDDIAYPLWGMVCSVADDIIVIQDILLSTLKYSAYSMAPLLLDNNKVFIGHAGAKTDQLYGMLINDIFVCKEAVSTIDGLTKKKCTPMSKGAVWVLKKEGIL